MQKKKKRLLLHHVSYLLQQLTLVECQQVCLHQFVILTTSATTAVQNLVFGPPV